MIEYSILNREDIFIHCLTIDDCYSWCIFHYNDIFLKDIVYDWFENNNIEWRYYDLKGILFTSKDDAMLFKLAWAE